MPVTAFVHPGRGGGLEILGCKSKACSIQLLEKGLQRQETAAGVTPIETLQPPRSHTELMFIMFIHKLIVLSGRHISGNLPEPGDLGYGHRWCRRLHRCWEAEGFPWALLIGKQERL